MAGRPYLFNPDERLDELHWVLSYHVHHLGRMADEMDRLSLPQAAQGLPSVGDHLGQAAPGNRRRQGHGRR